MRSLILVLSIGLLINVQAQVLPDAGVKKRYKYKVIVHSVDRSKTKGHISSVSDSSFAVISKSGATRVFQAFEVRKITSIRRNWGLAVGANFMGAWVSAMVALLAWDLHPLGSSSDPTASNVYAGILIGGASAFFLTRAYLFIPEGIKIDGNAAKLSRKRSKILKLVE